MIRLYFNIRNADGGLIWSIDKGDVSTEKNFKSVSIRAWGKTGFNKNAVLPEPSAWLEFNESARFFDYGDGNARIYKPQL